MEKVVESLDLSPGFKSLLWAKLQRLGYVFEIGFDFYLLFQPEVLEVMERARVKNLRFADSNEEAIRLIHGMLYTLYSFLISKSHLMCLLLTFYFIISSSAVSQLLIKHKKNCP